MLRMSDSGNGPDSDIVELPPLPLYPLFSLRSHEE